jgi:predicted O-methyltransferase YrrM
MAKIWPAISWLNYYRKSVTRFNVHSPFVYKLIENVFRDKTRYSDYKSLNRTRKRYARRTDRIETMDFGAASGGKNYSVRITTVGKLVRERTHTRKQLEFLYRMSKRFEPDTILEFGTAAGISALYLSKGYPRARMVTMEGCMGLASVAQKSFAKRKMDIEVEVGDFDAIIDNTLAGFDKLDMAFFDGNHRMAPTLDYFEKCLAKSHENSVFMFDDIHWSRGMSRAWKRIKKDDRVSLTIDLFWIGLVFFKKDITKQDLIIRY